MKADSAAVMAKRTASRRGLDDFPTPPWATRALFEHVLRLRGWSRLGIVLEPAANRGAMVRVLEGHCDRVHAADVHDYGVGFPVRNYLAPLEAAGTPAHDWMVTNPPFTAAEEFVLRGFETATLGVAVLARLQFMEGQGRFARLFSKRPPWIVAPFVERLGFREGRLDPGVASATAFAWYVWRNGLERPLPTELIWIPPCRAGLERSGDYL